MNGRGRLAILALAAVLSLPQVARTQEAAELVDEASARQYVQIALKNIHKSLCKNGPCPPTTEAELASPPVSTADARTAMFRGYASAMGEICGLNWQEANFHPMMQHWRESGKSDRAVVLLTMLHGMMQSQVADALAGKRCGSKERVAAQLTFKP